MRDHNDDDERKQERRRQLDDINQRLGEAVVAHSLTDEESEAALLDLHLDDRQQQLDELMHRDPLGVIWFGDNDEWLDKRLNNNG